MDVMTPLIESQVAGVDELVITKVDEATDEELQLARRVGERLNGEAPVRMVSALDAAALHALARQMASPGVHAVTEPDALEPYTVSIRLAARRVSRHRPISWRACSRTSRGAATRPDAR